jgi:hypothetical protein
MCELNHDEYPLLARSLAGVVFLGTPQGGSGAGSRSAMATVADVASVSGCGTLEDLQLALEREDGQFADLSREFARLAVVSHIPLFCFYEQPVEGKPLVDEHSGTVAGFPSAPLSASHLQICKFRASDDGNYILVRDQLIALTQGASGCVASRTQRTWIFYH